MIYVFDFDDTLFPTTFYGKHNCAINKDRYSGVFQNIEKSINNLFDACDKADIYVLSNGSSEWINNCIDLYCPTIRYRIKDIISARDKYENKFPDNIVMWKTYALIDIISSTKMTDVIFVSDLIIDFESVDLVKKCYNSINIITVKFIEQPEYWQLIKQHIDLKKKIALF